MLLCKYVKEKWLEKGWELSKRKKRKKENGWRALIALDLIY